MNGSFASYILQDIPAGSLTSDTQYFALMGKDSTRISFFKAFISMMRKKNPDFGKGCYVDSTPLPNDIAGNPFHALCCHGVSSSEVMSRLILVLDETTGLPVWHDLIPGNVLDINTIMTIVNDVAESLPIEIDSLVLDAGYISKEVVGAFHIGTEKVLIGRMPARKEYPFKSLYWDVKGLLGKGKYNFVRKDHVYFGYRKEIELFGYKEYAYVYMDKYTALKRYSDYLTEHAEEYADFKDRDKDWYMMKFGFFVLVSNIDTSPEQLLTAYFGRTDIETIFKTSKEYLDLLPLSKWSDITVRGKFLSDIVSTIILLEFRKAIGSIGVSTSEILGKARTLMCFRIDSNGLITVETPSRKVKEYYKHLDIPVPAHVNVRDFSSKIIPS